MSGGKYCYPDNDVLSIKFYNNSSYIGTKGRKLSQ